MKSIDKKIKRLVEDNQVKTITLDVFDTILMRKVWPEDQQFITVADKWLPYFREIISPEITRDKLYSWRQYARDELFRAQYELSTERQESNGEFDVSLELWFGHLIPGPQFPDRKVVGCMAFPPSSLARYTTAPVN